MAEGRQTTHQHAWEMGDGCWWNCACGASTQEPEAGREASTSTGGEVSESRQQAVQRLRDYLDSLDEQTRHPGEPPLREAVAEQARERLGEIRTTVPKPEHPPVGPSGVSPSPDGSR